MHKLRPSDISVIGAMGDSITVSFTCTHQFTVHHCHSLTVNCACIRLQPDTIALSSFVASDIIVKERYALPASVLQSDILRDHILCSNQQISHPEPLVLTTEPHYIVVYDVIDVDVDGGETEKRNYIV